MNPMVAQWLWVMLYSHGKLQYDCKGDIKQSTQISIFWSYGRHYQITGCLRGTVFKSELYCLWKIKLEVSTSGKKALFSKLSGQWSTLHAQSEYFYMLKKLEVSPPPLRPACSKSQCHPPFLVSPQTISVHEMLKNINSEISLQLSNVCPTNARTHRWPTPTALSPVVLKCEIEPRCLRNKTTMYVVCLWSRDFFSKYSRPASLLFSRYHSELSSAVKPLEWQKTRMTAVTLSTSKN